MSAGEKKLAGTLKVMADLLEQIKDASLDVMRVHPLCAFAMLNLWGNIGYALFEAEGELTFGSGPTAQRFETRGELIAHIFRQNALHMGEILDAQKAKDIFSVINLGKVMELVG